MILERTLAGFLQEWLGQPYQVRWKKGGFSPNTYHKGQIWLCNPYLNAIFVPEITRKTFAQVIREFWRSPKWWRRSFQKIYVLLATNQMTSKWFASAGLEIYPALNRAENLLIVGGNHHIRLLDYNQGCAFVIKKFGFKKEFMINEIKVRDENPYLPVPRIQKVANDKSWYSEDLILGTPVNRLKDASHAKDGVKSVASDLFKLLAKTANEIEIKNYVEEINRGIKEQIRENKLLSLHEREDIQRKTDGLSEIIVALIQNGPKKIHISQTHGDFQPANVLVNGDQSWLIDWEYTSRRQVAFDGLVYSLSSRFPQGLSKRVEEALKGKPIGSHFLMEDWPFVDWSDEIQRLIIIALFLLEELDLKLKENSNSLFKCLDQSFRVFGEELEKSIRVLQRTIS